MCARIALHRGASEVFGLDLVDERLQMAQRHGVHTIDVSAQDDVAETLRSLTDGRGPDSVIDAVGMEAHGAPFGKLAHQLAGMLPDAVTAKLMEKGGVDRLSVLHATIESVRRGGTISLSGVYGGTADPMPMMDLFDKQVQLRMGQARGARDPSAAARRRPVRHRVVRDAPPPARRRAGCVRDLSEEGRRLLQGRPAAMTPAPLYLRPV